MSTSKLNILLITSDQQHYSTLGSINQKVSTPALDRLAESGVRFDRAYCPNPTCSPCRSSIITGMYPSQHGCYSLGTRLDEKVPTLGEHLSKKGYRTALIGKAHFQPLQSTEKYPSLEAIPLIHNLDFWKDFHGPLYGFDYLETARNHANESAVGQHFAIWMEERGLSNWRDYFLKPTGKRDRQAGEWDLPGEFHQNEWIVDRVNHEIDQNVKNGQNFFLWASFFDPHPPYLVPQPWSRMYRPDDIEVPQCSADEHDDSPLPLRLTQQINPDFSFWTNVEDGNKVHGFHSHVISRNQLARDIAIYYGMVSYLDNAIGRILHHLETCGLAENTLVVFTSDHGHYFGQHGLIAKLPYHYEDLIRVPMIVRWPGRIPARRTSNSLQSLVDLSPTLLSAIDETVPKMMTGVNQLPVWTGEAEAVRDHVLIENHHQPRRIHIQTYVESRWKISVAYGTEEGELYDLQKDPGEIRNLWNCPQAAALKSKMLLKLVQANMGKEPVPMPRVAST